MRTADAIVVGGGPAGSTCAWKLREAGLDIVVLDRAAFPRTKLCAGWVTPEVLAMLELDPRDYPLSLMTFDELHVHWKRFTSKIKSRQLSIRRYEFDEFLLLRSGAEVHQHKVHDIRQENGDFVIDAQFRCKYLVGAGGTPCPVYRTFFQQLNPRVSSLQTATLEREFEYYWRDPACHLWFFDDGLPGYAWYVPKDHGFINIGLGGMAMHLKRKGGHLRKFWDMFTARLKRTGLVHYDNLQPKGYSYYLRGNTEPAKVENAFIIGDAAGLATHDLCEGIGPAVESGLRAARSIVNGEDYSVEGIHKLSGSGIMSQIIAWKLKHGAG